MGMPHQDSKKVICSFKPLFPADNYQPSAFLGRALHVMRTQETFHICAVITPPQGVGGLHHANVGYDLAIERARESNLNLPQIFL